MATKITVALEDDLDGGPASETVRFGLGAAQYEIDLNKKNARKFRRSHPSSSTPVRLDQASDAGQHGPHPAVSAAATSGCGPKSRASRSATAGASPPALLTSTKPPPQDPYARPVITGMNPARRDGRWPRPASQRRVGRPFRLPPMAAWARVRPGSIRRPRAKTFARTVAVTWARGDTPRPLTPLGLAAGQRATAVDDNTLRDRSVGVERARSRRSERLWRTDSAPPLPGITANSVRFLVPGLAASCQRTATVRAVGACGCGVGACGSAWVPTGYANAVPLRLSGRPCRDRAEFPADLLRRR